MKISFTKAHGARNDFLLTWSSYAPNKGLAETAIAICDRHTGIGADGWLLIDPPSAQDAAAGVQGGIRLYNSDGSASEISGNGTRCAAAFLVDTGLAGEEVRIRTGAGVKHLRLLNRRDHEFEFEMNMGRAVFPHSGTTALELPEGSMEATIVDVGNPQCVVTVNDFNFDWRRIGAVLERHPNFPNRTNVSFLRRIDDHTIDVRFFERGAGETMSSGTGSTGAAAVAVRMGLVSSPVSVITPAGPLALRFDDEIFLKGPAQIVGGGEFYL